MKKIFAFLLIISLFHGSSLVQAKQVASVQADQLLNGGSLELVSQFDFTNLLGMVANDDYAFVGLQRNQASEVIVLDLANPAQPVDLAVIPFYTELARPVAVVGDVLYVAVSGPEGLEMVDIATPSAPVVFGQVDLPDYVSPAQMVVSGTYAYLVDGQGLFVLDISNPADPSLVGSYTEIGFSALALQGLYAYTIGYNTLYIFDVSNPALPELLVTYVEDLNHQFESGALAVKGSYAYVAGMEITAGMPELFAEVIDVSNPVQPVKLSDLPQLAIMPRQLTFSGSLLYAAYDGGLAIFDASDPLDPQLLGTHPGLWGLAVHPQGDQAAYLDRDAGFQTVDTSDPRNPKRLGFYSWPQNANHLTAAGTNLYTLSTYWVNYPVYDANSMLQVIDITDPITPTVAGYIILDAYGLGRAFAAEPYVYVTSMTGLHIIDATDPGNLKSTKIWLNGTTFVAEVHGNTAYALTQDWDNNAQGWLSAIDVTNPMSPTLLGEFFVDGWMNDLSVAQQGGATIVYITTQTGWLALDVTNPAAPVVVFQDPSTPEIQRIETVTQAGQTIAYLAKAVSYQYSSPEEGVIAMDVSDPTHPLNLGIYQTEIGGTSVLMVEETLVYFADASSQDLVVVDFSNPAQPERVGGTNVPVEAWGEASLTPDYIIAANSWGELYIFSKRSRLEGRVTDHNYQPVAGVNLALSTGDSTLTDAQGLYSFPDLDFETYIVTPTLERFAFLPPHREAILPGGGDNQDFVMLAAAVSTTLDVGITTTLTYTDVQGLPTRFIFPPGLVPITGTATVIPTLADGFFGMDFAGHAFDLAVHAGVTETRSLVYPIPITVTIQYSELDASVITDTARLALYRLEQMAWVGADTGCPVVATPPILEPGVFQTAICQDGRYALFGPTHGIALPQVYYGSDSGDVPPIQ